MAKLYEITDNNDYKIDTSEFGFIILWKENNDISSLVEHHYKDQILAKNIIKNLSVQDRYNIICKMYNDKNFEVDERTTNNQPITLYTIKLDSSLYKVIKRGRTTEPRNMNFFNFKHHVLPEIKNINGRPNWFHSSDNAIEAYYILNGLKMNKEIYHTPYTYLDINILNVAVWNSWPHKKDRPPYNYSFKPLKETSQYAYLNGNKEPYIKFIKDCDPRNLQDFENLIKTFDLKGYNDVEDSLKLVNVGITDNNEVLIIDGCHRASILLFNNVKCIKVYIRNVKYPFYNIN